MSRVEFEDGRFPQVSGMRYVWDPAAPAGSRIVDVTVGGEPLEETATYTLATNDFLLGGGDGYTMLGGGDGYTMLADGDVIIGPEEGRLLSELIMERIIDEFSVEVFTDGRISTAG